MQGFHIYELSPAPWGDDYRYVLGLDTLEDANKVLGAIESVNFDFSCYRIINMKEGEYGTM